MARLTRMEKVKKILRCHWFDLLLFLGCVVANILQFSFGLAFLAMSILFKINFVSLKLKDWIWMNLPYAVDLFIFRVFSGIYLCFLFFGACCVMVLTGGFFYVIMFSRSDLTWESKVFGKERVMLKLTRSGGFFAVVVIWSILISIWYHYRYYKHFVQSRVQLLKYLFLYVLVEITPIFICLGIMLQILKNDLTKKSIADTIKFFNDTLSFIDLGITFLIGEHTNNFLNSVLPKVVFFNVMIHFIIALKYEKFLFWMSQGFFAFVNVHKDCCMVSIANIFFGLSETMMIFDYKRPSEKKFFILSVTGFTTIAGSLIIIYSAMGIEVENLMIGSLASIYLTFFYATICYPTVVIIDKKYLILSAKYFHFTALLKSTSQCFHNEYSELDVLANSSHTKNPERQCFVESPSDKNLTCFVCGIFEDDTSISFCYKSRGGIYFSGFEEPDVDHRVNASRIFEDEHVDDGGYSSDEVDANDNNVFNVISEQIEVGKNVVVSISLNLVVYIAIISLMTSLIYYVLNLFTLKLNMNKFWGWVMMPFSYGLGLSAVEGAKYGYILAEKILINEFVAYTSLLKIKDILPARIFNPYEVFLCGFSNFSCIGIQLATLIIFVKKKIWLHWFKRNIFKFLMLSNVICFLTAALTIMTN